MPALFVYSEYYHADMGEHIFPTEKYGLVHDEAIRQKILTENDFIEPIKLKDKDILLVHTKEHLERLEKLSKSPLGMLNGENPVNEQILKAAKLCCGGTYLSCLLALKHKISLHIGGGFHHAFPDHEEGFCYLNDIGVALKKLLLEKKAKKAMVIDCDVHQGNGTAYIFKDDNRVFTFSIHQEDNYPVKQKSDYDLGLYSYENVRDRYYLKKLTVVEGLIKKFEPDLIIYEAGADPYENDRIGGFKLTIGGLKKRDEYVTGLAVKTKVPIAIVYGGGYACDVNDTVKIHLNTVKVTKKFS